MHLRFSSCIGLPIVEEGSDDVLGIITGILIHPDTAAVEGFFLRNDDTFVASIDIVRWGTRAYVRHADVVAPAHDRIRLQTLLADKRTVLGQKIVTESGVHLGRCKDVQLNTDSMHIEWIFPRKLFRWGVALPVAEIIEIRPSAIIVKNRLKVDSVTPSTKDISPAIPELSEA